MTVLLLNSMISSCASDKAVKQLQADAKEQGRINAGINLPPYPNECRALEPYVTIKPGEQKTSIIDRSDRALDRANARSYRCGPLFYDAVIATFSKN